MRRFINLMLASTLFCGLASAQTATEAKPAEKAASSVGTALPSEETVNAFLQQTFGYDPQLTWKISSIKPSDGLAQVDVVLASSQGHQLSRFYVATGWSTCSSWRSPSFRRQAIRSSEKDSGKGNHRACARTEECAGDDCGVWRLAVSGM